MQRTKKFLVGAALVTASFVAGGAIVGAVSGQSEPGPEVQGNGTLATPGKLLTQSTATDDRFKAITPCRIVDTRETVGTFDPTEFRNYKAVGTGAIFASQGGKAGGCGIPTTASGIQMTVTSVSATGTGFIRAYPAGASEPTASFMNYGDQFNTSGSGAVKLNVGATDFRFRNYGSTTHIVIDVQGYYVPPTWVKVASDGTYLGGARVNQTVRTGVGSYRVQFDRSVTACSFTATGPSANTGNSNTIVTAAPSGFVGEVFVQVYTVNTQALKDDSFTLQVEC